MVAKGKPKNLAFSRILWHFWVASVLFLSISSCKDGKNTNPQNTLTVRLSNEPSRLNPLLGNESNALQVMAQLFQPLLDIDPTTLQLSPVLAKHRAVVAPITDGKWKGGTSYTFEIRENAHWDNGLPVTANDYIFTIKVILNPYAGARNYRSTIDFVRHIEIDSSNPRRFIVLTNKKYILAEENLSTLPVLPAQTFDPNGIMAKFTVDQLSDFLQDSSKSVDISLLQKFGDEFHKPQLSRSSEGVLGSGAYRLKEWVTGQRIVLVKKENWWGDSLMPKIPMLSAYPDRIIYRIISEEPTIVSLMKDGKLDATHRLSSQTYLEMKNDSQIRKKYDFRVVPTLGFGYIGINCKSQKFSDKRMRRALAHLVDVDLIISKFFGGFAEPCVGPFAPARSYYNKKLVPIALDTAKAKALFKQCGWTDSDGDGLLDKTVNGEKQRLEIRYLFPTGNASGKSIGLVLSENAKKVGIKINIEALDGEVFQERLKRRDFELYVGAFTPPPFPDDPKEIWATSSDGADGNNRFGFGNAASDKLIEDIRTELDSVKRHTLYQRFQEIIYDEQPAIFVFSPQEKAILNKRFALEKIIKKPGYIEGRMKLQK